MKMSLLPFQKIDQFFLKRIIQESPYTMSVQAFQPSLNRSVFIKLLKPQVNDQELRITRFRREGQICARLKHPNIVDVYTIGEWQNYIYMAMEFVRGISLKELLEKENKLSDQLSVAIIYQILQALHFAHQNQIVHRDLKPGNILVDYHGVAKLTDFGLAYLGEEYSVTQEGNILGTPAYMAPEQITGEPLTAATDLFALGVTFYEMLTGIKPFAGENYSACIQKILNEEPQNPALLNSGVSESTAKFVQELIAKNPKDRLQSSETAAARLESFYPNVSSSEIKNKISRLVQKYDDFSEESKSEAEKTLVVPKKKTLSRRRFSMIILGLLLLSVLFFWVFGHVQKKENSETRNIGKDLAALDSDKVALQPGNGMTTIENPDSNKMMVKENSISEEKTSEIQTDVEKKTREKPIHQSNLENPTNILQSTVDSPDQLGSVQLEISPWASVSVDGKLIDSLVTKREIKLTSGKHQFILSHPQFMPKIIDIDIAENEQRNINYSFLSEAAFLSIEVRPWAEVYIDRKFIDNTPLNRLIVLTPGEHLLELKHQIFQTYRQVLQLTAGDTLQIKRNMIK